MALRRQVRNRRLKQNARGKAKELAAVAKSKDQAKAQEILRQSSSALDKAAKHGAIHWKAAARKKSRLAAMAAKLLAQQEPAEKPAPAPAS
jgi:small subunit ribosomal protein S20